MPKIALFQKILVFSVCCLILSALPFLSHGSGWGGGEGTTQRSIWDSNDNLRVLREAFMGQYSTETGLSFRFDPHKNVSRFLKNVCDEEEYNGVVNYLNGVSTGGAQAAPVTIALRICIERYNLSSARGALLQEPQKSYIEKAQAVFREHFNPNERDTYPNNVLHLNQWLENYTDYKTKCSLFASTTSSPMERRTLLELNIETMGILHQQNCPSRLKELKQVLNFQGGILQEFFALAGEDETCKPDKRQCVGNLRKLAGLNKQGREPAELSKMQESEKSLFEVCAEGLGEAQTCCTSAKACPEMISEGGVQARYQSSLQNGAKRHGAKLCQAQNLTEMTNDYMNLTAELCVNSTNQCQETCNSKLTEFKQEFLRCFLAPDFTEEASSHLGETCKPQITEILAAYQKGTLTRQASLSFASKPEDIRDCQAALTAFKQRQNNASHQASVRQDVAGVCEQYAQANPSLIQNPSTNNTTTQDSQQQAGNRAIASSSSIAANTNQLGTNQPGNAGSLNQNNQGGGEAQAEKKVPILWYPPLSDPKTAKGHKAFRHEDGTIELVTEPEPVVNKTPEEWREYLLHLKRTEKDGFDPIQVRADARAKRHWMDCIGFCDEHLYGDDSELRPEVMEAAKIPVYDPEEPLWRGDYFDGPQTNRGNLETQGRRKIRRAALRREYRRKQHGREWEKQQEGYRPYVLAYTGNGLPVTEEQIAITRESHKRMLLREYELFAISCLDALETSGKGYGCSKKWTSVEEREFWNQQLRDIRERKDPFYSWRGKGVPMPIDDVWFRPDKPVIPQQLNQLLFKEDDGIGICRAIEPFPQSMSYYM